MRRKRVLIATLNEDRTRALGYRLRQMGDFEIVPLESVAEVVAAVEETPPDLIFMDLRLPLRDGSDPVRRIRALERGTHVPIVALNRDPLRNEQQALADGWDAYLAEPVVDPAMIRQIVERFLGPQSAS